jgi:peptide/nickel transport system ATP-binding protein
METQVTNGSAVKRVPPVLEVQDLSVHYETPVGAVKAVEDVSFSLASGERLALVGESGSGKTTLATGLLKLIREPGRIVKGRIILDGRDITDLSDKEIRRIRLSEVAYIPQGAMNSLNPVLRVETQIIDGIRAHLGRLPKRELRRRVVEQLASVNLDPSVCRLYPHELSGGMKQRVAMAISTALSPKVIVADEPTSALDVVVQRDVMATLGRLQEGLGAAVVLIGHDMGLVAQFADLVVVMYAGRIVELAPVERLYESPQHPYTRLLIDSLPDLDERRRLTGIPGLPPSLIGLPDACAFRTRCPYAFDRCHEQIPAPQARGRRHEVRCHLYPEHDELPPLPEGVELLDAGIVSQHLEAAVQREHAPEPEEHRR